MAKRGEQGMKHLFICATPFHLMTAINLSMTNLANDEVSLYILDHSDSFTEMYNEAMKAQCFQMIKIK